MSIINFFENGAKQRTLFPMNLLLRMLYVIVLSYFRPRIADVLAPQRLTLRVLPTDLDTNGHMNNGRYFTLMDLGRFDLILRSGLLSMMMHKKSVPVLAATTIRFRLDLDCWQKYHLDTRILCWDDKWLYMEQRFIYADGQKKDVVAAIALLKGGFYDRNGKTTVPTRDVMHMMGLDIPTPAFPVAVTEWIQAENALRDVTKTNL